VKAVIAAGLPALTPYSITNPVQFLETLERIRTLGVSYDSEEASLGLNCVAAPIFNHSGAPVAAMSVSGPVGRLSPESLIPAIRAATLAVGRQLGYQPRSASAAAASAR
jgi:DNA-binding IclR family transcriptional regulator